MMVPTGKMLFWTGWLVVPLGILSAFSGDLVLPCVAVFLAAALVAVTDLMQGLKHPLGIEVTLPDIVRFSRMRAGEFTLALDQVEARPKPYSLRLGIRFPDALDVPASVRRVELPGTAGRFPVGWTCTPLQRGQFFVDGVQVESLSPLGLWAIRRRLPARTEIRVYPNLTPERNRLASVFLNKSGIGIHAQRQVGKGREFEQLRDYIPGDSYEDIHWKATARRGFPVTKTYQIERTQEVYVVVDASRLSARSLPGREPGEGPEPQLEHLLRAALLLGVVAERQGDFFGLATFSDRVHTFIRASKGRGHFNSCREALYTLQPQLVNPDFEEICTFIRLRLRRRALIIFLTNLDDPVLAESLTKNLEILSRRHLVMVNMVTPAHIQPLFGRGPVESVDEIYAQLGGHLQWQSLRETQRSLHRHGVDLHLAGHEQLCGDLVTQYVNVKQRQLL